MTKTLSVSVPPSTGIRTALYLLRVSLAGWFLRRGGVTFEVHGE